MKLHNKIIHGDFFELAWEIPEASAGIIYTDPPYPREFQKCYDVLAMHSNRILEDGGSLVVIAPQYNVPYVVKTFAENSKLKYRWMLIMNQEGGKHARMAMGIEVCFKVMLWYVKRAYPQGRGFLKDMIPITGTKGQVKPQHVWEQDWSWPQYYLERLNPNKRLVLDPYVGAGTVPIIAKQLGMPYCGIDIDQVSVEITRKNLEKLNGKTEQQKKHRKKQE